ncbi:hypothetical protein [Pedobacter psychrodurus]|uniref:hypothetical protein n=1 Tax=Pedobacter psychrodurus TaxID=2530456 RepID=UPI00292EF915|nr:hypothetical protein [Pedobacter psychrodurus]
MERKIIRIKPLFIPYYFCMMNYAIAAGIVRYINQNQSAACERSSEKVPDRMLETKSFGIKGQFLKTALNLILVTVENSCII